MKMKGNGIDNIQVIGREEINKTNSTKKQQHQLQNDKFFNQH